MDRIKGQLNVKLSTATIEQIKALAARRGESQANVVSIAVDRMAQAEESAMKYYVEAEMMGDSADSEDVSKMVALLQAHGVPAEAGSPLHSRHDPDACPDAVWEECLDILSREKYNK